MVLGGGQVGIEKGVIKKGVVLYVPKNEVTDPMDGHERFSRS